MTIQPAHADTPAFDPAARQFIAQSDRPGGWSDLSPAGLTPLLRVLLVIDGTVTRTLEAWFFERVEVQCISQTPERSATPTPWLETGEGQSVMRRAVRLVGQESGRMYACAESLIVMDRLPARTRSRLQERSYGIGRALLASGAEVRREGLWYGQVAGSALPAAIASPGIPEFIGRTYRIVGQGRPLMQISEFFPADLGS